MTQKEKTLEQYIAERRENYSKGKPHADGYIAYEMLFDCVKEMPRVLDMLEKQQKAIEAIDVWQGKQSSDCSVFQMTDDEFAKLQSLIHGVMQDLEKMVNE